MLNENICQISWNASGEKLAVATSLSGVISIKLYDENNLTNYLFFWKVENYGGLQVCLQVGEEAFHSEELAWQF